MSDLKKYNPPPGSSDLYLAASKHFQQAKLILENVATPDPEVCKYTGNEPPVLLPSLVTQSRFAKHPIKVNQLHNMQLIDILQISDACGLVILLLILLLTHKHRRSEGCLCRERVNTTQNGRRLAVILAPHLGRQWCLPLSHHIKDNQRQYKITMMETWVLTLH